MGEREAQSLTGIWHGRYFYPRTLAPVSFVATLIETATRLTGVTHESPSGDSGPVAYATLLGQRHGSAVTFVKTYDDVKRHQHPIEYAGSLNGDATEIEGIWQIRAHWSGTFLMIRAQGKAVSVARRAYERA